MQNQTTTNNLNWNNLNHTEKLYLNQMVQCGAVKSFQREIFNRSMATAMGLAVKGWVRYFSGSTYFTDEGRGAFLAQYNR